MILKLILIRMIISKLLMVQFLAFCLLIISCVNENNNSIEIESKTHSERFVEIDFDQEIPLFNLYEDSFLIEKTDFTYDINFQFDKSGVLSDSIIIQKVKIFVSEDTIFDADIAELKGDFGYVDYCEPSSYNVVFENNNVLSETNIVCLGAPRNERVMNFAANKRNNEGNYEIGLIPEENDYEIKRLTFYLQKNYELTKCTFYLK